MTIVSSANTTADTSAIVADFAGDQQQQQSVQMMIGIGLIKDNDAVYFEYVGDDQKRAIMEASGKPCTRIGNVRLTGLSVVDDVYSEAGFKGSKINVFVETQNGHSLLLTAGLTTIWTQCLMTSLMGLYSTGSLDHLITIQTWKGNSKMKPCFAAVYDGRIKVTDNEMYQALTDARSDRDYKKTEALIRDAVSVINAELTNSVLPIPVETEVVETEF